MKLDTGTELPDKFILTDEFKDSLTDNFLHSLNLDKEVEQEYQEEEMDSDSVAIEPSKEIPSGNLLTTSEAEMEMRAIQREFKEECGLELPQLKNHKSFRVYSGKSITYKSFFKSNNRYLTQENSWKLHHKGKEHTEARWVSVSDINLTKRCFFGKELRKRTVRSLKSSGLF